MSASLFASLSCYGFPELLALVKAAVKIEVKKLRHTITFLATLLYSV
jgi:hypothetical protein